MPTPADRLAPPPRRVLIVVEDPALAELLDEALSGAGHRCRLADGEPGVAALLATEAFDAAIVDLDTRARDGRRLLVQLGRMTPATTRIALLPCGALVGPDGASPYDVGIEKPARLEALLRAIEWPGAPACCKMQQSP